MNIYYDSDKLGLKVVAEIDFGGSFDFDIHIVFENEKGEYYYLSDSGCSCPTPFDGQTLKDGQKIDKEGLNNFIESFRRDHRNDGSKEEIERFLLKIKHAINGINLNDSWTVTLNAKTHATDQSDLANAQNPPVV